MLRENEVGIVQARSFSLRGKADWSPSVGLDEHRRKKFFKLARFSVPGAGWISPNVRAHADSFSAGWTVGATCDLREVHGATAAVVFRRWRDAMFEGPFGRSPEWIKLAEPSSSGTVRFHLSLKQWLHVQPPPFREHKD